MNANWQYDMQLQLHATGNMNATDSMMQLATMNYATMQSTQTTNYKPYGNKTTSIRQMAYSGPKSDRLHNDNKNDSISAPRHPSMSGHHLENYSSHHNKTDQFLLPNCPKPTQAVTTCMDY